MIVAYVRIDILFKVLICVLLVPVLFLTGTSVYQFIKSFSDSRNLPVYGKKIQTDSGEMNVVVMGDKKETIVFL